MSILTVYLVLVHNYYLDVLGPAGPERLESPYHFCQTKHTNTLWKSYDILAILDIWLWCIFWLAISINVGVWTLKRRTPCPRHCEMHAVQV